MKHMPCASLLLALLLTLPACSTEPAAKQDPPAPPPPPGYRILKEGNHRSENWLELNEYFLIHHLGSDILRRFDLESRFDLEDKIRIFASLLYNLDYADPVNLIVDRFKPAGSLVISLQLIRVGRYDGILLATNTDRQGSTIFVGPQNVARTYKRVYLIVADQLVALGDLYSREKEQKLIRENSAVPLARFYIFDGNRGNDTVAEGLLIGSIREAADPVERIRTQLTLSRYYISQGRLAEAEALLLATGSVLSRSDETDTLKADHTRVYEELLITGAIREHGESLRRQKPESL